ncbi:MAG: Rpn family recombination-promoting nuclease/putative transposase [Spirulinaceae cyanobacterium]
MRFVNPKTDFAFKKIFGSENSKNILISFLNALLYEGQDIIQDLEIIETYSAGKVATLKDSYLDVKARISDGTNVIIEMQVINVEAFKVLPICQLG